MMFSNKELRTEAEELDLTLFDTEETREEDEKHVVEHLEKHVIKPNRIVKREIACELLAQGLSESAICRILNIEKEDLSDLQPSELKSIS